MRVVFAGTPSFATPALEALVRAGHQVALVLTQPDRPAGRGLKVAPSHVAATATRLGLPVWKPTTLRNDEALAELRAAGPEVMVVAAYGLILPQAVLDVPTQGCLNIHASVLPRWRGAAPVHRAILAGDAETGVSIMRMDAGLDTGAVLLERPLGIAPQDTTGTLTDKLAALGAETLIEVLRQLPSLPGKPQDAAHATYARKVAKSEAQIDWTQPAELIVRQVRAFNPSPGAEGDVGGMRLKVWDARIHEAMGLAPGTVAANTPSRLLIGTGDGSLEVLDVQRLGGRRMPAEEFLRGKPWATVSGTSTTH